MAVETRGPLIRTIVLSKLGAVLPIPTEKKGWFQDGFDVNVVMEVKHRRARGSLAISSGIEFVVPEWVPRMLKGFADDQGLTHDTVANFYLSSRPVWLVTGAQDPAARQVAERFNGRPALSQITDEDLRAIILEWLEDQARSLRG